MWTGRGRESDHLILLSKGSREVTCSATSGATSIQCYEQTQKPNLPGVGHRALSHSREPRAQSPGSNLGHVGGAPISFPSFSPITERKYNRSQHPDIKCTPLVYREPAGIPQCTFLDPLIASDQEWPFPPPASGPHKPRGGTRTGLCHSQ